MTNITSAYSKAFEQLIDGVIVAHVGVVLAGRLVDGHETLFEMAHYAILAFFVMELAERLRANGSGFLRLALRIEAVLPQWIPAVANVTGSRTRCPRISPAQANPRCQVHRR